MLGGYQLRRFAVTIAVVFTALAVPGVSAQGLQNVLRARARVFPTVGPGVAAVKRDSSGRYFILAEPASVISIFDRTGKRVDQFPNVNSHGATIRYAVAIDLDSRGRLFVADRGDNSIKIFAPDGSLVAAIHVTAPTSVVALSEGQFAVTTLQSKRLVQIMDEKGTTVRTFGDPSDQSQAAISAQPLMDRGRITGDSSGNIYFAFTSLPDPTVQRSESKIDVPGGVARYSPAIHQRLRRSIGGRHVPGIAESSNRRALFVEDLHEVLGLQRRDGELTVGKSYDRCRSRHVNRGDQGTVRSEDLDGVVAAIGDEETPAQINVNRDGIVDRSAV